MEWWSDLQSLGIVVLAGGLGGIIGLERELSDKPAGLKTHILVAVASALLILLGQGIIDFYDHANDNRAVSSDPIRMIQAIVIGISFLGAGTIVHQADDTIDGLTTAASILVTSGVGIAVAADHIVLAAGTALFAMLVLLGVGWAERRLHAMRSNDSVSWPAREWKSEEHSLR